MVTDIRTAGNGNSNPANLAYDPTSKKLFFSATGGNLAGELHTYDTVTGAVTFVKDINPGLGSSLVASFTRAGGWVYFAAEDTTSGRELWRTDGTDAGTTLLTDICAGTGYSSPQSLTPLGGDLLFTAVIPFSGTGRELYMADGVTDGQLARDAIWII